MPFVAQNFVNGKGPAIGAVWLNGVDVTCNFVLAGAATVAQALAALGITGSITLSNPVTIAQGGTGQTTAAAALTALGGVTPAAAQATAAGLDTTVLSTAESFTTTSLVPYALLAGPTFTGVPAAPTAAFGTNTTQLATMAAVFAGIATGSLANPGYVKIPLSGGGTLIVQFGTSGAGATVTYPIAFTTLALPFIYPVTVETTGTTAQSLTGFTFTVGGGVGVSWFAIGY